MSFLSLGDLKRDIMHSAAFRLTLWFAGIFVVCLLVLNLGLGMTARWITEREAKAEIDDHLGELREAFDGGGAAALARTIFDLGDEASEAGFVFGHQAAEGGLLAGELSIPKPAPGWIVFLPEGIDPDEAFWAKSVRLPDGTWLNVAASTEYYHDLGELMRDGAIWTIAIALPLALLSGALLSQAVMRRLGRIIQTVEAVRAGELSRRAPLMGSQDEFDRLAGNINAMLETIESLTRNLRNVSVGIAHELRSPLTRIRNRLVDLKENATSPERADPERDDPFDATLAEIDGALTTFDALLKIGQIESDARRQGFETIRFSELVAEIAEVYQPVATEQGMHLNANVAADVEIRGNRALLAQMISNLLENAIEHTPKGTTITVELSTATDGRKLVVQDDGPGIPMAESERIFDRFYRLDRSGLSPGNGLGLSLVRSICGLHGFTAGLAQSSSGARFEISM